MTQPDPRKIVADTIGESIALIRSEVRDAAADAVLAALRDAGWRPPEGVQDLTEKLEYATLQLDTAAAVGRALIAERDAARATIAVDRATHARLFEQRDEAIEERDRLRRDLDEYAALLLRRPQDVPVADVAWKLRRIAQPATEGES